MIGVLLVAALLAIAFGGALSFARASTFQAGLIAQAVGAAGVSLVGFWTLGSGTTSAPRARHATHSASNRLRIDR